MDARQQILAQFPSMSPRIQAAARFVVDHPNEVVIGSMRTLAERAAVQPATLVRLAQQLGYAGWPALKAAFAGDLGLSGDDYAGRARRLSGRARKTDLAGELFAVHQRNLDDTLAQSAGLLKDTAKLLQKARTVHVAGFRASFPIVYALYYGYRLFRTSVHQIDGRSDDLAMQVRAVERADAVVVASFSPYSSEAVLVARAAAAAGARLVAITDSAASPLALIADRTLLFSAESPSFFPSIAAGVAVVEALLERLVADAGPSTVARIDASERQLYESGAYVGRATVRDRKAR